MKKSESITNIAKAILSVRMEVGKIAKTANNPFFKSKYADLPSIQDAIDPVVAKHGLSYMQSPSGLNDLTTIIIHIESGEYIEDTMSMPPVKQDPQGQGSAITYMRRYALVAMFGLNVDDDDDGNEASKPKKEKQNGTTKAEEKPWLNKNTPEWEKVTTALKGGYTVEQVKQKYKLSRPIEKELELLEVDETVIS